MPRSILLALNIGEVGYHFQESMPLQHVEKGADTGNVSRLQGDQVTKAYAAVRQLNNRTVEKNIKNQMAKIFLLKKGQFMQYAT